MNGSNWVGVAIAGAVLLGVIGLQLQQDYDAKGKLEQATRERDALAVKFREISERDRQAAIRDLQNNVWLSQACLDFYEQAQAERCFAPKAERMCNAWFAAQQKH